MTNCDHCQAEIPTGHCFHVDASGMKTCAKCLPVRNTWQARAEAAEQRVKELLTTIDVLQEARRTSGDEISEWRQVHAEMCKRVIPGEVDSIDAYRQMLMERTKLSERVSKQSEVIRELLYLFAGSRTLYIGDWIGFEGRIQRDRYQHLLQFFETKESRQESNESQSPGVPCKESQGDTKQDRKPDSRPALLAAEGVGAAGSPSSVSQTVYKPRQCGKCQASMGQWDECPVCGHYQLSGPQSRPGAAEAERLRKLLEEIAFETKVRYTTTERYDEVFGLIERICAEASPKDN